MIAHGIDFKIAKACIILYIPSVKKFLDNTNARRKKLACSMLPYVCVTLAFVAGALPFENHVNIQWKGFLIRRSGRLWECVLLCKSVGVRLRDRWPRETDKKTEIKERDDGGHGHACTKCILHSVVINALGLETGPVDLSSDFLSRPVHLAVATHYVL